MFKICFCRKKTPQMTPDLYFIPHNSLRKRHNALANDIQSDQRSKVHQETSSEMQSIVHASDPVNHLCVYISINGYHFILLFFTFFPKMHRVQVLSGHLSSNSRVGMRQCSALAADPNDIVVVHGLRTAIGRAKRGSFKVGYRSI